MDIENRILAFDYGAKRIGTAISDPMAIIANGLGIIYNDHKVFEKITQLIGQYNPKEIVLGMPFNLSGNQSERSKDILEFSEKLKNITSVPIAYWDERFTSKIAQNTLLEVGLNKKKRAQKERIDEISAIIILQNYLDHIRNRKKD